MPVSQEQSRGSALERSRELEAWFRTVGADAPSELILQLANTWAAIELADDLFRRVVQDQNRRPAREYLVELDIRLLDELKVHIDALDPPLKALIDGTYGG